MKSDNKWISWVTEINSIAQAGLTYSKDKFDLERFERLKNISAEMISKYTEVEISKVRDLLKEEGYKTPKVDIRGAIIENNKILLVKELDNSWSLPGGWADVNLSVSENIIKEAKEEAGINIKPKRVIAIYDRNKHNTPKTFSTIYKIFVLCDFLGGEFEKNIETTESKFFEMDNLPKLSISRNTKNQIIDCFKAYENNNLKTIFD
ncbi:MAG: NUDIX hydrolase N-terminal domain-containing protein [Sarcina sp.]